MKIPTYLVTLWIMKCGTIKKLISEPFTNPFFFFVPVNEGKLNPKDDLITDLKLTHGYKDRVVVSFQKKNDRSAGGMAAIAVLVLIEIPEYEFNTMCFGHQSTEVAQPVVPTRKREISENEMSTNKHSKTDQETNGNKNPYHTLCLNREEGSIH